jgi:hypothetical protein
MDRQSLALLCIGRDGKERVLPKRSDHCFSPKR